MMNLRNLCLVRSFSVSSSLRKSFLSADYKSKKLWNERFNCGLLRSEDTIKEINTKIIQGVELNNLEVDLFINIASARTDEIAQLQESVRILKTIRKSLYANTILPSTQHAFCRLFLDSERLTTLIKVLENRVDYGLFPDFFALNLMLDNALEKEDYTSASRLGIFVMLQEEFGLNRITDALSLYSSIKYIESKTDFSQWSKISSEDDSILNPELEEEIDTSSEKKQEAEQAKNEDDEDEDEDDAEYVRLPFLRNPYFDNHFDIINTRIQHGKTLSMISRATDVDQVLANKLNFLGSVLQGRWSDAISLFEKTTASIDDSLKDLAKFYVENLHEVIEPNEDEKSRLQTILGQGVSSQEERTEELSKLIESKYCLELKQFENQDLQDFRKNLVDWSEMRFAVKKRREDKIAREKLIEEIRAKKEELKLREQYLYFYDNLKKSRVTRIEYN